MPAIKYKVELTQSQRSTLVEVSRRGKPLARTLKRALALLKATKDCQTGKPQWPMSAATVARTQTVRRRGAGSRNQRPATAGPGA